ncbi:MAG: transcription elongation factor [Acidilobaceae archaeon]|nr:transcription elongation factor [Acidilobaceae archaeon]
MRFCPRCGSVVVPVKKGDELFSRCTRCGYEEKLEVAKEEYKSTIKAREKVITTKVISKSKGIDVKREEELEQAKDSYYEIVLDQIGEYGE